MPTPSVCLKASSSLILSIQSATQKPKALLSFCHSVPELKDVGIVDLNKAVGKNSLPSEVATAIRYGP